MESKTIVLSPKINWRITLFLLIFELILTGFIPMFFCVLIEYPEDLAIVFAVLLMVIVWITVLDMLLWQFRGKEILVFNSDILIAKQQGRLFNRNRQIEYEKINNLFIEDPQTYILCFAVPIVFKRKDTKDIIVSYKDKKDRNREARIGQRVLLKDVINIEQQISNYQSVK